MAQTVTLTVAKQCSVCESAESLLWSSGDFSRTLFTSQFSDSGTFEQEQCYKCTRRNGSVMNTVDIPCKLLIVGDAGVGKTCFVQRYINKKYTDKYSWTVGGK